jgi:hypothetical protein
MSSRAQDLIINDDMSIHEKVESEKVKIIILDGHLGKAKVYEAVHHGRTIIETYAGKTSGVIFDDREKF